VEGSREDTNKRNYMRLQKYLSEVGFCSRRDAEDFIRAGKIVIDGHVASLGDKVTGKEKIVIDGKELVVKEFAPQKVLIFNKPKGVECTLTAYDNFKTLLDFDFGDSRVFPIGHLDRESSGLLLLTNDGDLGNRLAQPSRGEEYEYFLTMKSNITEGMLGNLAQAITRVHRSEGPCKVEDVGENKLRVVVINGKAKQIRKACAEIWVEVVELKRQRIGRLELADLASGSWRVVTDEELGELHV